MSDSERPNPQMASFEVPDLELEPVPRSIRQAAPVPQRTLAPTQTPTRPDLTASDPMFGATFDFGDELGDFELERTAQPSLGITSELPPNSGRAQPIARATDERCSVFTGRAPDAAKLVFDPRELAILSDYGEPPDNAARSLAYAYRVFTRQRELKHQLVSIAAESARAEQERETTLAEFARALRPAIEQHSEFRRFLQPVLEVEQRAAARGQALNSINAQLGAHNAELDAELARVESQIEAEQRLASEARGNYEECEANAKRADAKLKRVKIEMRAVTQVAEQKLAPAGGAMPAEEMAQLAELEQRAQALEPEVTATRGTLEHAKLALNQVQTRLEALRQSQRQIARKKQAVGGAYQKEISARSEGVSEAELEQRRALAELGSAVLAAPTAIAVPEAWLGRVRDVCERADPLFVRAEMFRRAIASYDARRAQQGVRLACTAAGLMLVLFLFKLIF